MTERLTGGRHGLPAELVSQHQRHRLLEAMVSAAAERGYERLAVADVLKAAGVSRATFYKLFADKLDCFLAAYDAELERLVAATVSAYEAEQDWAERVRTGIQAALDWLAGHPSSARVLLIEIAAAGPAAKGRYRTSLSRLTPLLDDGYQATPLGRRLSPFTARMAIGSGASIVVDEVMAGRTGELPRIASELAHAVLVPFLGPREAAARTEFAGA
jgi:AcrR family transcriptional regulator